MTSTSGDPSEVCCLILIRYSKDPLKCALLKAFARAISAMSDRMEKIFKAQTETIEDLNNTVANLSKAVSKLFKALSVSHSHCPRLVSSRRLTKTISRKMSERQALLASFIVMLCLTWLETGSRGRNHLGNGPRYGQGAREGDSRQLEGRARQSPGLREFIMAILIYVPLSMLLKIGWTIRRRDHAIYGRIV